MSVTYRFPHGFLWGAATSSHQVEGNNRWNDWWEFEQSGRLPHRSEGACRHFELYERDFDLAQSWGHNAHRLSIEWSRIEPVEGHFSAAALDHYASVARALRKRGLEPVVTLHHFTNPAWFTRRGGWVRRDSVDFFRRYVEAVSARLGQHVRYWVTINEPTIYVTRAFLKGDWPPCQPASWLSAARALRNLCRAHGEAYFTIHRCRSDAMVGFAHSAPYVVARRPPRRLDRYAARLRDFVLNRLCFRLLGRAPHRVLDYIGINYYSRQVVRWRPWGLAALFGAEHKADDPMNRRQFNSLGWEIYPEGLREVVKKFAAYGVPLMITENGVATSDETLRKDFIAAHVGALALAMRDGARVLGYFYWTLFDNFEWAEGMTPQFGLAAVVLPNQTRIRRPAVDTFERICRSNEIPITEPTAGAADPAG
jgi:beta-glucosidase